MDADTFQEFQRFMAARGIPVYSGEGNSVSWKDTPVARTSVQAYLGVLRQRKALIAENLANEHTTAPVGAEHYRRREIITNDEGKPVEVVDCTELTRKYEPEHPCAGSDGYVPYTNVDHAKELLDDILATRTYNALCHAMGECDPSGEMKPLEAAGSASP